MELHQLKSGYNYFTIILYSSVGTPEGHSEALFEATSTPLRTPGCL